MSLELPATAGEEVSLREGNGGEVFNFIVNACRVAHELLTTLIIALSLGNCYELLPVLDHEVEGVRLDAKRTARSPLKIEMKPIP